MQIQREHEYTQRRCIACGTDGRLQMKQYEIAMWWLQAENISDAELSEIHRLTMASHHILNKAKE